MRAKQNARAHLPESSTQNRVQSNTEVEQFDVEEEVTMEKDGGRRKIRNQCSDEVSSQL
jgi:hypothetical protein